MNDFEYDCLQKKRIAGQAKYRKRGSKSKKCTLPSDRLTHKQWKDRCGPVNTFNFGKPMNWETYKQLPAHIQAEYIVNLQKKYGATAVDLGDMFGVRALTVRKHAEANNLGVEFPRGHAMSAAHRTEWMKFIKEEMSDEENISTGTETQENHSIADNADYKQQDNNCDAECIELTAPDAQKPMSLNRFSLHFGGAIDINMIANSLKLILGDSSKGELEIVCHLS